jgi:hypothetical protein
MSLRGPSKTVIVEPLTAPAREPGPAPAPAPAPAPKVPQPAAA